jgi:hypothetical protein
MGGITMNSFKDTIGRRVVYGNIQPSAIVIVVFATVVVFGFMACENSFVETTLEPIEEERRDEEDRDDDEERRDDWVFPPPEKPALIYDRLTPHIWDAHTTRYVLYDDNTFELQGYIFERNSYYAFTGKYSRTDTEISFEYDGWSTAGPWIATGIFEDEYLIVEYNIVMWLSDFEPGVYVLNSAE